MPEIPSGSEEKINDLIIFGIEYNSNNVNERHMFLVNNLKTHYYKRARVLHPDKGGNENDFKKLSSVYEKLLSLRDKK